MFKYFFYFLVFTCLVSSCKTTSGDVPIVFSLVNMVTGDSIVVLEERDTLNRVELPPQFSIEAHVKGGCSSVVFSVDRDQEFMDSEPPYILDEKNAGWAVWSSRGKRLTVKAMAYSEVEGNGVLLGTATIQIMISSKGMDVLEKPLTNLETLKWLSDYMDSVMQKHKFSATNGLTMPYRLFVPKEYTEDVKYPLLIHLHGRGERGTDNRSKMYDNIKLFNGENAIISPNGQQRYPCIILVPQCSDKTANEEWAKWVGNTPQTPFEGLGKDGSYEMAARPSESGGAVMELISRIIQDYSIDSSRIYITGLSMGGFGTWEYVSRMPELFAAAVPMAGYSDPRQIEKIRSIPFWIFHGGADDVNPVQGSQNMYRLLREAGAEVHYTEFPEIGHSPTFNLAWEEEDLLPWIFSQRK